MRNSVVNLLDAAQKRMGGYVALAHYRLVNLCVKARPEVLLSFGLESDGESLPIEEVARVCNADNRDDQFEIYPMKPELLFPIIKDLKKVHPEFKVEVTSPEDSEDEEDRYLLVTMPVVDQNRHDVLMEGVDIISDWCDGQLKTTFSEFTAQIALKLADAKPEEMDEAKDVLQQFKDKHDELSKQYRDNKKQEIEDAFKQYQEVKEQEEARKQEQDDAHNLQAGLQMKWPPEDE